MAKLENQTGYFLLDGIPQQKGEFRIVTQGKERVGLSFINDDRQLTAPIHFSEWVNKDDIAYATKQDLIDALASFCFNSASGSTAVIPIKFNINQPYFDQAGRLRVSEPTVLGDYEHLHDKNDGLIYEDGSGTGTFNNENSCIEMTSDSGQWLIRQSKRVHRYLPGFTQFVELTSKRFEPQAGFTKRLGYYSSSFAHPHQDELDGFFIETANGGEHRFEIWRRGILTVSIPRSSWDDPMDGSGASGVDINFTNFNIIAIDFLWLGGKGARLMFAVGRKIIIAHQYDHSNDGVTIFTKSPDHPIRYEILSTGAEDGGRFDMICGTVLSEGAINDVSELVTFNSGNDVLNANTVGTVYAILGIRLKLSYRYSEVKLAFASVLCTTADRFRWSIRKNPTVLNTFTYLPLTDKAVEVAVGNKNNPSNNTVTGGEVIAQGEVSDRTREVSIPESSNSPLTINIEGIQDEHVLCIEPLSGGVDAFASMNYKQRK